MVLENLGQSLRNVLKKITGASHIDEALVKEITRDIQRALLQADVNVKLVLEMTKEVERRALNEEPPAGTSPKEHVVRIIYDELIKILGTPRPLPIAKQTIMMVGLYGQGKTTTTGKLARYFHKKGLKVGVIAADVHRPAAYDQLQQIADKVGVQLYGRPGEKDATKIARDGMLARELGIPLSIASSTKVIRQRERVIGMDAMASGDRSFVYQVVVGVGADLNRRVSKEEKKLLGRSAYLVAMLRSVSDLRPLRARCRIDGREVEMWVNQLIVANAGILGTAPLRLGPGIRPDDGRVEVVAMRGRGRLDLLGSGMDMVLGNYQAPSLRYFVARREIVLETSPITVIKADGEYIGQTPLTLRVRPGAVKVIVPASPAWSALDKMFGP